MTSTWHRLGGPMSTLVERGRARRVPRLHLLHLRGPGALPRVAERHEPGELPGLPAHALVPRGPRRRPAGPAQGQAEPRPLRDRLADPEGQGGLGPGLRQRLPLPGPAGPGRLVHRSTTRPTTSRLDAEFDPALPYHIAIDSGVFTGAVFFQVREVPAADGVAAPARAGERLRRVPGRGPDGRGVRPGDPAPSPTGSAGRPAGRSPPIRPAGPATRSAPR